MSGIPAADFSRIRNANLGRFSVDRLMTILDRLREEFELAVTQRRRSRRAETDRPSVV